MSGPLTNVEALELPKKTNYIYIYNASGSLVSTQIVDDQTAAMFKNYLIQAKPDCPIEIGIETPGYRVKSVNSTCQILP